MGLLRKGLTKVDLFVLRFATGKDPVRKLHAPLHKARMTTGLLAAWKDLGKDLTEVDLFGKTSPRLTLLS
jgi:hypothetical protein